MELIAVEPRLPRRRLWLQFILTLCFITCLIVGMGSLAALILLRNGTVSIQETTSLPQVDVEQISPALALNQLADDPAGALALQLAAAGEFETTNAILAFDTTIPTKARAGIYQLLSKRIAESNLPVNVKQSQIKQIQRQARQVAVLSPDFEITQRSQLLLQGTQHLLNAGEPEDALLSATNLQRLAEQMPELLPAQRRQILEPLAPLAEELASPQFEQRLDELLRNPFLVPSGGLLPLQLNGLMERTTAEIDSPALASLHQAVAMAEGTRKEAARALIHRITAIHSQGRSAFADRLGIENEARAEIGRLADALRAEDLSRRQMTEALLADPEQVPATKLVYLFELHGWTADKARIAVKGFGLSIVPDWENNISAIEQELTSLTQTIDRTTDEHMETLGTSQEKAALRVDKFLWLALQAEQGLYPNASIQTLSNDLRFAQVELANQGIDLALPVFWDASLTSPEFRIQAKE